MEAQITTSEEPNWLHRWGWVVLAIVLGLPYALAAAALGNLFVNPIGGSVVDLDSWGTIAWASSALLLTAPAAAVPGPRRALRIIVGLVIGVVWFVLGRYLLRDR